MGAHASYPLIIYNLVSIKSQFQFIITEEKFQGVLKELSEYEIYFNSDNKHLPDHILLAKKLNLNQAKTNKLIRELLDKILNGLSDNPLIIKYKVHTLHISPYIEPEDKNKEWVNLQWARTISIPVVLPVTPRIGDSVEIPFVRISYSYGSDDKLHNGAVHEIIHTVNGTMQEINLYNYPHKNIYYKWLGQAIALCLPFLLFRNVIVTFNLCKTSQLSIYYLH
jgi:hypothetical protein